MKNQPKNDTFGINIMKFCREHEQYIENQAAVNDCDFEELLKWHEQKLVWLAHERLIHLLVTILTAIIFLFLIGLEAYTQSELVFPFLAVTFCMLAAYLIHYFRLENHVQHWYKIAEELHEKVISQKSK